MISDLDSFFNKKNNSGDKNQIVDLVVSTDNSLIKSIRELYIIEGWSVPESTKEFNENNVHHFSNAKFKRVILDMRGVDESTQISEVDKIIVLLDVNIHLFVLSDVDSIKLQNAVNAHGATYVLWDENLNGLNSEIQLETNRHSKQSSRTAKRILVLGTKGGVGVSSISSTIAYVLSSKAHLNVLLVDHDANSLCSDVYLGLKKIKLKSNVNDLIQIDIDEVVAQDYVHSCKDKLDYLALSRNELQVHTHSELLHKLSSELISNYNIIIDSVSLSSFESLNLTENIDRYHHIYVVCEPSVPSLRAYNIFEKSFTNKEFKVIFNLSRNTKSYVMSLNSAKGRIKNSESIDFVYEEKLDKLLLTQGVEGVMGLRFMNSIAKIIMELTGKNIKPKLAGFSLFKK